MPPPSRTLAKTTKPISCRCVCSWNAGARNAHSCQRMTGKAIASPTQRLITIEVRNGSATPRVVGLRCFGSGPFSQWMILTWNANATPNPTQSAISETTSRPRSSPRCSTSVASSPWRRRRGGLIALRVGLRRGRDGFLGLRGGLSRQLRRRVVVLARNRILELAHTLPERLAHLRQPLRAEDQQDDHEQDCDFPGTNPSRHSPTTLARSQPGRSPA